MPLSLVLMAALVAQPEFHVSELKIPSVMGRHYWSMLAANKGLYADPACKLSPANRKTGLADLPLFREAALWYGSGKHDPTNPATATWRKLTDNYAGGEKDQRWLRLCANAKPNVPIFAGFGAKRSYLAQCGKIDLDCDEFQAWRSRYPNLVAFGVGDEWANDLHNMSVRFANTNVAYKIWKTQGERDEVEDRLFKFPKTHAGMLQRAYAYANRAKALYWGTDECYMLSACFFSDHIAADWGAKILGMETTNTSGGGDPEFRWDVHGFFVRGAARQFSLPWQWYVAQFVDGYYSDGKYEWEVMCNLGENRKKQNPTGGCSPSLIRRVCYYAYLNGANFIEMEDWGQHLLRADASGASVLSSRGEDFAAFHDFTNAHPDRGETYTPVAILTPLDQGYTYCGGFNWRSSKVEYRMGDHMVDGIFFSIIHGFERGKGIKAGREFNLHNSPHAMMYDVLVPDSAQPAEIFLKKLKAYPAAILAGEYPNLQSFWPNMEAYVKGGGTLLVPGANLPEDARKTLVGGEDVNDERGTRLAKSYSLGAGRMIVAASDWMVPKFTNAEKTVAATLNGTRKFPEIEFFLDRFQQELFPFSVKGTCQYGANRTKNGWWLWALNNDGVTKFLDTFEKIDESQSHTVEVDLKNVKATKVTELITGRSVVVRDGKFSWPIPAAKLAIFQIEEGVTTSDSLAFGNAGESQAIVIPAKSRPVEQHAARELQRYLGEITGETLPILTDGETIPKSAIVLGHTKLTPAGWRELGDDGFRFIERDRRLFIDATGVHGVLFGVYDFLERFAHCEWLAADCEVVPKQPCVRIPAGLDETHIPAFVMRDENWRDALKSPDFAAKLKLNGFHIEYGEKHGGRSIAYKGYGTFDAFMPAGKLFDQHPDWFAEVDGRRVKYRTQPCLTNPEVVDYTVSNVFDRIARDYPRVKYYNVMQNDWRNWCTCRNCKAIDDREGSHAATVISFMNEVTARVIARYPDVYLRTLAYSYTRYAPKTIKAHPHLIVVLCPDQCDYSKSMTESRFKENVSFVNDLAAWGKLSSNLTIWDYSANFICFPMAFPCMEAMAKNFRWYARSGVKHMYVEGVGRAPHMNDAELKTWLIAQLLWDPNQSYERLLERFLRGYYGAAAPYAAEYYRRLAALPRDETVRPLKMWGTYQDGALPLSFFDWASENWQKAAKAVTGREAEHVRWALNMADFSRIANSNVRGAVDARSEGNAEDPALISLKAAAKRIVTDFDANPDCWKLAEDGRNVKRLSAAVRRLADPNFVAKRDQGRARIEEELFAVEHGGTIVDDALAENGRAVRVAADGDGWAATFGFADVRTDPKKRYQLRARIRIDPGEEADGTALRLGVHDSAAKKFTVKEFRPKASALSADYRWYDIGEPWSTAATDNLWFGTGDWDRRKSAANPAVKAIYLDCLELVER